MLASILKHRMEIQEKTTTLGPMGDTITWDTVKTIWGRRIPLSVTTVAAYQQMNTVVTDKIIFRGTEGIELGKHRILYGSKTYEPQATAKHYDGVTEVIVSEA